MSKTVLVSSQASPRVEHRSRRERAVALARVSKQYSDLSWQTFATLTGRDFHPSASPRPAATMELGLQHAKRASELAQEAFDIFPDDGLLNHCRIKSAECSGEASVNNRKGRTFLIYEFEVKDMPVSVAVDTQGTSVHQTGPQHWRGVIEEQALELI